MQSIFQWMVGGGVTGYALLATAIVGAMVVGERVWSLVLRPQHNGRLFIEELLGYVRAGELEKAVQYCARAKSALPDMGLLILRNRTLDQHELREVARAAALSLVPRTTRYLPLIPPLARTAIGLGILGLVLTLREALIHAAAADDATRAARLASGVAAALDPLAAGILVAIALTVAHGWLSARAALVVEQLHELSSRLVNALADRPDVRLGHR